MSGDDKCYRDGRGRLIPCGKRSCIGPSEYAYGRAVHCAFCDVFLRAVEPVKKGA